MMEKVEGKKIPVKWIAVGVVIGIVIIASLVLLYSRPKPEIISVYGHEGLYGLNYVYYVEVTVRNNGGDGWIKVFAEISGAFNIFYLLLFWMIDYLPLKLYFTFF